MSDTPDTSTDNASGPRPLVLVVLFLLAAVGTIAIVSLLVSIFQHKQDARTPFVRVAEVTEVTTDPRPWGANWPSQFDAYKQTAGDRFYGGSSAMPESKLDHYPWLKRLFAGYAFSLDYREARGHAYMLYDQGVTERVTKRQQSGACLHCHASVSSMYRRVGLEDMGLPADEEALGKEFNWEAVMRGFELLSTKPYHDVLAELRATPDGTPDNTPLFPTTPREAEATPDPHTDLGPAHPVSCVDCHDPSTLAVRVTRPGFVNGIAALAASDEPVPMFPSIEAWRRGPRNEPYNPNLEATRQEMRSFTCGQCHVEYYCANKMTLTFPWKNGLKMEQLEQTWEETVFPDGTPFFDYIHGETGAPVYKVQHPEFELWSQGIHARNGVSCADCHMPYQREGAKKVSSHNVRSPLDNINAACQTCHNVPESQLRESVAAIQDRTTDLTARAAEAMTEMLDTIREAQAFGVTNEQLAEVFELQRAAMWRLDYIASENSRGFHADQEAARILGESIDYSRRAALLALRLRAPEAPDVDLPVEPIQGVTPKKVAEGQATADEVASNK